MKTILYISNHNPFGTSYGAEQRSNILLKAFLHNGCHVDVPILAKGLVVQKVLLLTLKSSIGMTIRNGKFQDVQIGKGWL